MTWFEIRRRAVADRRLFYLTKSGGWSPHQSKAEKFATKKDAVLMMGYRIAFVARVTRLH